VSRMCRVAVLIGWAVMPATVCRAAPLLHTVMAQSDQPFEEKGLKSVPVFDGQAPTAQRGGVLCWSTSSGAGSPYLYWAIARDAIAPAGTKPAPSPQLATVDVEYLDTEGTWFCLEYSDQETPDVPGRYVASPSIVSRGTGTWLKTSFLLEGPRFSGSFFGADFRLAAQKGDLYVRAVRVSNRGLSLRAAPSVILASGRMQEIPVQVCAIGEDGQPVPDGTLLTVGTDYGTVQNTTPTEGGRAMTRLALPPGPGQADVACTWLGLATTTRVVALSGKGDVEAMERPLPLEALLGAPVANTTVGAGCGIRMTGEDPPELEVRYALPPEGGMVDIPVCHWTGGVLKSIALDVAGDGTQNILMVRMRDTGGNVFQYWASTLRQTGWTTVTITPDQPSLAWGSGGRLRFPLEVTSLIVHSHPQEQARAGVLRLRNLRLITQEPTSSGTDVDLGWEGETLSLTCANALARPQDLTLAWQILGADGGVTRSSPPQTVTLPAHSAVRVPVQTKPADPVDGRVVVTAKSDVVDRMVSTPLRPAVWGEVALGPENQACGLHQVEEPDGPTVAATITGRLARAARIADMYFLADRDFSACRKASDVMLEAVCYSGQGCELLVEYDSDDASVSKVPDMPGAFKETGKLSLKPGAWTPVGFRLSGAWLRRRCNGADLRIKARGGTAWISKVTIRAL